MVVVVFVDSCLQVADFIPSITVIQIQTVNKFQFGQQLYICLLYTLDVYKRQPSISPRFLSAPDQANMVATELVEVLSPFKCL